MLITLRHLTFPKKLNLQKEKKAQQKVRKKLQKKRNPKKSSSKKAPAKKKSSQPLQTLSKELQAVVGEEKLSRPEVVKRTWDYIKAHNLQDPKNKRLIVPDEKLAKVFGSKQAIDMMKLSGILGKHFKK